VVERKEASGCEKRVSTSGAFSTGWWEAWVLGATMTRTEEWTDLEGVVEDEYDYAVHVIGDAVV